MKRKSLPHQQGGWGTFSIVFEDNPNKHRSIGLNHASIMPSSTQVVAVPGKKSNSGSVTI